MRSSEGAIKSPHFLHNRKHMKLILGDCLDKLKELDDNSIDSIVTDPPYGLAFMGKRWDYDVPSQDIWEECLRVLKPGGYLLSFAGSRTYHRMAVRIEDAGFEIRDQIMWVYGSGFPKSMNIGIQVDKKLGNQREVIPNPRANQQTAAKNGIYGDYEAVAYITKGNSEWEGWGTALKPAHEPIVMARKPFKGTVVDNVLEWGTGGINIDESRIGTEGGTKRSHQTDYPKKDNGKEDRESQNWRKGHDIVEINEGRFPANIIFDEEAGKILDEQSGITKGSGVSKKVARSKKGFKISGSSNNIQAANSPDIYGDAGGASRFFYCPKASKRDRNEGLEHFEGRFSPTMGDGIGVKEYNPKTATLKKNHHPTVKPTDLMLYLIRLVTPNGGTTLDPFMGSGSTGKGAVRGGFHFFGIEREQEYFEIAEARIEYERDNPYDEKSGKRVKNP